MRRNTIAAEVQEFAILIADSMQAARVNAEANLRQAKADAYECVALAQCKFNECDRRVDLARKMVRILSDHADRIERNRTKKDAKLAMGEQ